MKSKISFLKTQQRELYKNIRKKINLKNNYLFNKTVIDNFFNNLDTKKFNIISSFFSINTEIPTDALNNYLNNNFQKLVFPVVKKNSKILSFRLYRKNQNLIKGNFGIPEPELNNDELKPDLIFVPCLAFDNKGFRLGYGGGYYDRTFEYFESINHKFISIGYAYENQMTDKVITDEKDYKLNYVLTEKQLYTFI